MREILISIQPKWCELITSGKKTVEVRKTKPKLETPFKVYIYETQGRTETPFVDEEGHHIFKGRGQVIGEFVCDRIDEFSVPYPAYFGEIDSNTESIIKSACLKPMDIHAYNGTRKAFGWHITDLVVYDEPRELSKFYHYCGDDPNCIGCEAHYFSNTECGKEDYCCSPIEGCKPIKRAPQSWQFCVATEPRQTAD